MVTTDDQFFTAAALAQEARRFANCGLAHVAGAGHWPQFEQPLRLCAALSKFLAGIGAHPVRA
jgi:pimeloyl-ACP methyl ester carboxylesterase